MDPKWLFVKVVAQKGCSDRPGAMIGRIGHVSHHLGSLLDTIELTVLCAFLCKVRYFDAQIRETLMYK